MKGLMAILFLLFALLGGVIFLLPPIKEVQVRGGSHIPPEEVRRLIAPMLKGKNLLTANLGGVARKVGETPWVKG